MDGTHGRLQHRDLTGRILRAFFEVYNELGHGFLESVYHRALRRVLFDGGLRVDSETRLTVWFRGEPIAEFKPDLVVENTVVVELKAARAIDPAHEAQVLNYLRATELEVGLLLNFGPRPAFRRLVYRNDRKTMPKAQH